MDKEQFYKALYNATNGTFECPGFKTCMGWNQEYDNQGRPLRADPNYLHYQIKIDGVKYNITKRGWDVYVWKPDSNAWYTWVWYKDLVDTNILYIFDTTPDYVKEYYAEKELSRKTE